MLYCNIMGPPSYMWSVVDRNVVMRRIPALCYVFSRPGCCGTNSLSRSVEVYQYGAFCCRDISWGGLDLRVVERVVRLSRCSVVEMYHSNKLACFLWFFTVFCSVTTAAADSMFIIANCIQKYRVLVRKREGKRPCGRPRYRWEDNIKMDLQEWNVGVWTGSSWLRIGTGGGHLWMR